MPTRWCRSQKPAKSTASAFPVVAGCHPAVLTLTRPPENGSDPEGIAESAFRSVCPALIALALPAANNPVLQQRRPAPLLVAILAAWDLCRGPKC